MIMKRVVNYLVYSLLTVLCMCLNACTKEDLLLNDNTSLVKVIGRVTTYDECNVTTKGIKTSDESHINSMCLFIFDNAQKCINIQYLEGSNPTFIIARDVLKELTSSGLTNCQLYIVANVDENVIKNKWNYKFDENTLNTEFYLNDLLSKSCETSSSQMLSKGFPMIGNLQQNLDPNEKLDNAVIEIPLDNLYAKIVFNIKVNTHQTPTSGFTPQFQLFQWEVHNLPKGVCLGGPNNELSNQTPFYNDAHTTAYMSRTVTGTNPASGSNVLSFTFYMPEHLVNSGTFTYPTGIKDEEKQRYKPKFVSDSSKPTFVKIKGGFTDHQGHLQSIEYDVYLGSNNTNNFQIKRNCQYNNNITITGGTNHKDAQEGTISVDHRVTKGSSGYYIAIEQEATLDAHWNVVPMDLYIDEGEKVTVTIEKSTNTGNTYSWIRMERIPQATMAAANYAAYTGIRDYFTTNLVTQTLAANTSFQCSNRDRIYFYIDENISLSKRTAKVSLSFSGDPSKNKTLTFTQVGLKPVTLDGTTYYIEDKEEYLYHYDPLNTYATNQIYDGLPWGAIGKEVVGYNIFGDRINDENLVYYSGYKLTEKVTAAVDNYNSTRKIYEKPTTAAEYCNNKGKRNPSNNQTYKAPDANNGVWYLPAIREMETIMEEYYDTYEDFQENFYWSSTPARTGTRTEAKNYARATRVKVTFSNGSPIFNYYQSGDYNDTYNYNSSVDYDYFIPNGQASDYSGHAGYNGGKFYGGRTDRSQAFRIRAAYRPPTGFTVPTAATE